MYIIHILGIRIGMPLVKQWYHMFELRRYAACFCSSFSKCYTRLPDVGTHACIILDIMSHYCTLPNTICIL